MANGDEAYNIMRDLGIGINNANLDKFKKSKRDAIKHKGKIFLQVEAHGEAYYIDFNGALHYLKSEKEAYNIMRNLGLGITNKDLSSIRQVENISAIDSNLNNNTTIENDYSIELISLYEDKK